MGLFSSKKKIFVGLSNSKIIEDGKAPQAIKDSVTAYISDSAKSNGAMDSSLVDYSNMAIDMSIVQGAKRLKRWVAKPERYSTVGSSVATLQPMTDNDIQNIVAEAIRRKYDTPVEFFYLNNLVYDYGHLTKQVLVDTKGYDPSTNKLTHNGVELYLEDATIKTQEPLKIEELFPFPFTALATPFREEDLTRTYQESNFEVNPEFQFDFFEAIGTNILTISNKEVITTTTVTVPAHTIPATETEPEQQVEEVVTVTEERGPVEVINNIPELDKVSQVFIDTTPEEIQISDTSTTDENGVITQVVVSHYFLHDNYECRYSFQGIYSDYIYSEDIAFEDLPTDEAIDYIEGVEEPDISIQIAYTYKSLNGERIIKYETLTEEYVSTLYTEGDLVAFGDFMPNLYFKHNFYFVDSNKNSLMYKQSKKYAKKLSLNFSDFSEEIRKEVKDQKPIIHAYLKFGVNYDSTNKADIEYMYNFFKKYFNYCDRDNIYPIGFEFEVATDYPIPGKPLNFKDKILTYNVEISKSSYFRGVAETPGVAGTYTTGNGTLPPPPRTDNSLGGFFKYYREVMLGHYKYFRYYITDTEYEEYRVFRLKASNHVKDGKWAESGGENSHLLIPVDFSVLKDIDGFRNKERFLYNSMYIEFLTYVVQKVKWYQRGAFKLLVFAISVVVSAFLGPAGMTLNALVTAAVVNLAVGVAINFAIKQLAKMLSPQMLKIVAGIIAIAGLAYGKFASAGAGSFSKAFTIIFMKANQFLSVSNQIIKATIQKQAAIFNEEAKEFKEKMKTLEDYKKANYKYITDTSLSYLNEQVHRYEPMIVGETITDMVARTLNTNPGLVTIDYIHGYVDYIITLPTVDETKYISLDEKEKDNAE